MSEQKNKLLEVKDLKVSFFTPAGEVKAVGGISYDLDYGEVMGVVGESGSGKSTLAKLLIHYYDPQQGSISIGGQKITEMSLEALNSQISYVAQDQYLFNTSLLENIRMGRPDATDEEVVAAGKLANAHEFIERLPQGYDTLLTGDGANLSQGQRQLLAIARAAIADPPALILDEATSSIDTRTEKIVQDGMDKLMHGRTTFVIAHRLSTVKNSDCIMVLEQGRIIERGTHDQLIEKQGRYYQLYTGNAITAAE